MSDPNVESAYAFLRSHTTGELRFEDHLRPIKYVIAPSGRLVAPAMVAMLQSMDTVLFVPDASENATEVQVTLERFKEEDSFEDVDHSGGALADRWRIHHGEPPDVQWAFLNIDAVRHDGLIVDGEALTRPNPLHAQEAAICKELNRDRRADLHALCIHVAGIEVNDPLLVGVDPLGFDVRGRFDVIRIPAPGQITDADDARAAIDAMSTAAREALAEDASGE